MNRQRLLWGVIGFVAGAAVTFLITSERHRRQLDNCSVVWPRVTRVRGECWRSEERVKWSTGSKTETGKTWPVVKHELKMEVAGQTLSETACAVSGSSSPFSHPATGTLYFNNAESGTTVNVTGQKVDGRWVLYNHNWRD